MKLGFSDQYNKPCIIIAPYDYVLDVIEMAETEGAIFQEGPDPIEDRCYVVQFPDRPKELYTREALKRSFPLNK